MKASTLKGWIEKILTILLKSDKLKTTESPSTNLSTTQQSTKKNMTYAFSKTSRSRLETCHDELQRLFNEVIKHKDCSILEGARSDERQAELYFQGKSQLDGVFKKSNHQVTKDKPKSFAVDVMPYPIDWGDLKGHAEFAAFVFEAAVKLDIKIKWGGNWKKFKDNPHWELDRKYYA